MKRDVKKKVLHRPEAEKIVVSTSSPLFVRVPLDSPERFCFGFGFFTIPVGFMCRW
jgi:hypothetical protein